MTARGSNDSDIIMSLLICVNGSKKENHDTNREQQMIEMRKKRNTGRANEGGRIL